MSVFKKLKDVLFDVEEEEIPVITKEEKKPVREEPKREANPIKEVKMPKEEVIPTRSSSFNFPLDDFEEEKPKTRVREVRDDLILIILLEEVLRLSLRRMKEEWIIVSS